MGSQNTILGLTRLVKTRLLTCHNKQDPAKSLQNILFPQILQQELHIVSGLPMICGGGGEGTGYSRLSAYSVCYQHSKALNTWTILTNMTNKRASSASVPLNGKLWVIGGLDNDQPDDDYSLSSTEYVSSDGDESLPGPDLPSPRYGHCAVKLSTGQVMILGDGYGWYRGDGRLGKSVILFDPDTEIYTSLPSLKYARSWFGCAVFKSAMHDNREVVLAAGGSNQATAEILDYTLPNAEWTESNNSILLFYLTGCIAVS